MSKKNLISELPEEQLDELLAYTPGFSEKNLENIKRLSLEKIKERPKRHSIRKIFVIAAAAALLLITSFSIFAATGGLEQFLSRFNPNFGEFAIAPLYPAYAESQEIRIEAVGAQQIGSVVLVYLTMRDLSGENRLTRYMRPDLVIRIDGQVINGPSSGRQLEFDNAANTVYFEIRMVGGIDMPRADTIELTARRILCAEHWGQMGTAFEGDWAIKVNTSDLGIRPITWTDISVGSLHIEYMSLTPFGLHVTGYHEYDLSDTRRGQRTAGRPFIEASVVLENRWRNIRFPGAGGGIGPDHFDFFSFSDGPIDLEAVTAVIINGERIQVQ